MKQRRIIINLEVKITRWLEKVDINRITHILFHQSGYVVAICKRAGIKRMNGVGGEVRRDAVTDVPRTEMFRGQVLSQTLSDCQRRDGGRGSRSFICRSRCV